MTNRTISMTDTLYDYYLQVGIREPKILQALRKETAALSSHRMQIAPEQGQFMAMLVKLTGASAIIELGTYTGYSSLAMAMALPMSGKLLTCDTDAATSAIAQRYWRKAGVEGRIELRLGPALSTLNTLTSTFDLAFIDADKRNYLAYYELLLERIRPGGLILVDNVLWSGRLTDVNDMDNATIALREFNQYLKNDIRIELCMIPIGDGLTLARKL